MIIVKDTSAKTRLAERRSTVNIVVLVKQVPDTETKIKIGADGKSIETSEIKQLFVFRTALGPTSPFLAWVRSE
jgi:hypothetical protein